MQQYPPPHIKSTVRRTTRPPIWLKLAVAILGRRATPDAPGALNATLTINRRPDEVYAFLRDFAQLPRAVQYLVRVRQSDGHALLEFATTDEERWDIQVAVIVDAQNERLVWQTLDTDFPPARLSITLRPAPGNRGTELHCQAELEGTRFGRLVAAVPEQWLASALRRVKQVLETGDIVRSDASIHRGRHPARPAARTGALAGGSES